MVHPTLAIFVVLCPIIFNGLLIPSIQTAELASNKHPCTGNEEKSNCDPSKFLVCKRGADDPSSLQCLCRRKTIWSALYNECRVVPNAPCTPDAELDNKEPLCLDGYICRKSLATNDGNDLPQGVCAKVPKLEDGSERINTRKPNLSDGHDDQTSREEPPPRQTEDESSPTDDDSEKGDGKPVEETLADEDAKEEVKTEPQKVMKPLGRSFGRSFGLENRAGGGSSSPTPMTSTTPGSKTTATDSGNPPVTDGKVTDNNGGTTGNGTGPNPSTGDPNTSIRFEAIPSIIILTVLTTAGFYMS